MKHARTVDRLEEQLRSGLVLGHDALGVAAEGGDSEGCSSL